MYRYGMLFLLALLAGCQTTHEQMIAQGYPPVFADGFQDGCSSGQQAAGAIGGTFKKDVPRYLKQPEYATGWDDGFRQCQAIRDLADREDYHHPLGTTRRPGTR